MAVHNISRDSDLEALIDRVISVTAQVQQRHGYIYAELALDKLSGRLDHAEPRFDSGW